MLAQVAADPTQGAGRPGADKNEIGVGKLADDFRPGGQITRFDVVDIFMPIDPDHPAIGIQHGLRRACRAQRQTEIAGRTFDHRHAGLEQAVDFHAAKHVQGGLDLD